MTTRCAIVNLDTKTVVNVIEYESVPVGLPPGLTGNLIAVADDHASTGWIWNGTTTVNPAPLSISPQTILPQDLMAQFTATDAAAIQAAITGNVQFWLLWNAMTAQKDSMLVTNARFLSGWNALVQVLGQPRMTAIAAALGVTVG